MNIVRPLLLTAILCGLSSPASAIPQRAVLQQAAELPSYPAEMPGKPDKKALEKIHWLMGKANAPICDAPADNITILGEAEATQKQMVDYIRRNNPAPRLTCSLEYLVKCYYEEAGLENIRPDVALCQAIRETGFFRYGNDVAPAQNNFCGLGAVGNRAGGASFATAKLGVRAHIQHLMAYATKKTPSTAIIDPRYHAVVKFRPEQAGKSLYWTDLNGTWAIPGKDYGEGILRFWRAARELDTPEGLLRSATQLVQRDPKNAQAYAQRALIYLDQGNSREAIEDFSRAISLKDSAILRYNRAIAYEATNPRKSIADYNHALKLDAGLKKASYNRALLLYQEKKYKEAAKDFKRLLSQNPTADESSILLNNIAVIEIQQKKYKEAWKDLLEAAKLDTSNKAVLSNQKDFHACLNKK